MAYVFYGLVSGIKLPRGSYGTVIWKQMDQL